MRGALALATGSSALQRLVAKTREAVTLGLASTLSLPNARARTTALSLPRSAAQSTTLQPLRSAMGHPRGARTPSTHVPLVLSSVKR